MSRYGRFAEDEAIAFLARIVEAEPPPHARGRVKGPCRVFVGARNSQGYGNVWIGGRNVPAHVLMWELVTGKLPTELLLHACDNPPCASFDHLSEGTALENFADMASKGRASPPPHPCASDHPEAKLDDEGIAEAKRLLAVGWTQNRVAERLGVSQPLISAVANDKARMCRSRR